MNFDIHHTKNKQFKEFMQTMKVVIIDQNSSSRVSIRRMAMSYQVRTENIIIADNFLEGKKQIEAMRPRIIFGDYEVNGQSGIEFLKVQSRIYTNQVEKSFFLLANNNGPAISNKMVEEDIDALIVRPFTYEAIQSTFLEVMQKKCMPSAYLRLVSTGRQMLTENNLEGAFEAFSQAREGEPRPVLSCYYLGVVHQKKNELEKAKLFFQQGLKYDERNYKCLSGLFEVTLALKDYDRAFEVAEVLIMHHPFHPPRVPLFIKLAIGLTKFNIVNVIYSKYCEYDEKDEAVTKCIAAGLTVVGKAHLQKQRPRDALEAFHKAENIAKTVPAIIKEIVIALVSNGLKKEAEDILVRAPNEVRDSPDVRIAELESLDKSGVPQNILKLGLELIGVGVKHPRLYEIVIARSIEMKRRRAVIDELVHTATELFPDQKGVFQKFL